MEQKDPKSAKGETMSFLPLITPASGLSTLDFEVVDLARDPCIKGSLARSTMANPNS
jgi:hypothetical protein